LLLWSYPESSLLWPPPTPGLARRRLCIPVFASRLSAPTERPQPGQVSQVPDVSFGVRCPHSPRRARTLMFVDARSIAGFTNSGRLAALTLVTRPKRVHTFVLRLTPSLFEAPYPGLLRGTLDSLHGERTNYHEQYLSTIKKRQASPDAPENTKKKKKSEKMNLVEIHEFRPSAFAIWCPPCLLCRGLSIEIPGSPMAICYSVVLLQEDYFVRSPKATGV
jgi:hypothetical protein